MQKKVENLFLAEEGYQKIALTYSQCIDYRNRPVPMSQSPIVLWIQQQLERCKKEKIVEEQKMSNHHGFHL